MSENREYKSNVFSLLMKEPKYALQTYNALNQTNYDDVDEIKYMMLENGISLSIRNDASFIISSEISFYEHQSTYNPNMPLRGLIYFAGVLKEVTAKRELFSRKLISIPTPHFVVFYNGKEKRPEVEYLKLSDAFEKKTDDPQLELKCTVYNINEGNNVELVKHCEALRGYNIFVSKVQEYDTIEGTTERAVERAIQYCIEHDILSDFFIEHRLEVTKMAIIDMTWEKREPLIRMEEREDGIQEGLQQGLQQSVKAVITILKEMNVQENEIIMQLKEKLELDEGQAKELYEKYKDQ